ncbi:hypothetical protein D9M70_481190 [compost metagenome]
MDVPVDRRAKRVDDAEHCLDRSLDLRQVPLFGRKRGNAVDLGARQHQAAANFDENGGEGAGRFGAAGTVDVLGELGERRVAAGTKLGKPGLDRRTGCHADAEHAIGRAALGREVVCSVGHAAEGHDFGQVAAGDDEIAIGGGDDLGGEHAGAGNDDGEQPLELAAQRLRRARFCNARFRGRIAAAFVLHLREVAPLMSPLIAWAVATILVV